MTDQTYTVEKILRLRDAVERLAAEHGDTFTHGEPLDLVARHWGEIGFIDPAALIYEWASIGVFDTDAVRDLREAGVSVREARMEAVVDGAAEPIGRLYADQKISIEEAVTFAAVDPLKDLRDLAQGRATAEHALSEVRRLGAIKAREARAKGSSVAEIAEAFGVSRQGAYDLLG